MGDKDYRGQIFFIEATFLLKYDISAMKIFKLFSVIEYQGGLDIHNITIHP